MIKEELLSIILSNYGNLRIKLNNFSFFFFLSVILKMKVGVVYEMCSY